MMWGNFLKSKQRDEELAFLDALYDGDNRSSKPARIHTSILTEKMYVSEVLEGHELICKRDWRMEKFIFHRFVKCIRDRNLLKDTRNVSVEEQVAIFLYAVSKNSSNRTLQGRFQHSGETISRHFRAVLDAIIKLSRNLIQLPPINIPFKVSSNKKFMPYFKVKI